MSLYDYIHLALHTRIQLQEVDNSILGGKQMANKKMADWQQQSCWELLCYAYYPQKKKKMNEEE